MLACRREPITDVRTRNHGYDVIVGEELFTDYLITLANLSRESKTQINRRRTLPASFRWWEMPTASSLAWKTSLRKVRTLWHCSRLRSVALTMIDRGDIRSWQLTVAAISGLHCRALVMVSSSMGVCQPDCKIQQRAWTVREIDVWAESPRLFSPVICNHRPLAHGLKDHYRDNAITYKAQRQKCQRTEAGERGKLLTCRCVSVMLLRSMQNTRRS